MNGIMRLNPSQCAAVIAMTKNGTKPGPNYAKPWQLASCDQGHYPLSASSLAYVFDNIGSEMKVSNRVALSPSAMAH